MLEKLFSRLCQGALFSGIHLTGHFTFEILNVKHLVIANYYGGHSYASESIPLKEARHIGSS